MLLQVTFLTTAETIQKDDQSAPVQLARKILSPYLTRRYYCLQKKCDTSPYNMDFDIYLVNETWGCGCEKFS
jgi:hypothetical protein